MKRNQPLDVFRHCLLGDGCWEWQRAKEYFGYGAFHLNGRQVRAHRVAWEWWNDESAGDRLILHHCDNPSCIRPDHLYAGTYTDNNRDSAERTRRQEMCAEGHPYSEAYVNPTTGKRRCRICRQAHRRERGWL